MAASSITKQFVVRDNAAYARLLAQLENVPERKATESESRSLEKGRELLKQYSSR